MAMRTRAPSILPALALPALALRALALPTLPPSAAAGSGEWAS